MIYYTVTNLEGKYLRIKEYWLLDWGTAEQATLFRTPVEAHEAGCAATDWCDDPLAFNVQYHNHIERS